MDKINVVIALAILFLVGIGAIITLIRQVNQLEEALEDQIGSASYYSKESLDRFEEISLLRLQLVSLVEEKEKLQKELISLKKEKETVELPKSDLGSSALFVPMTDSNPVTPTDKPNNYKSRRRK